MVRLVIAKTLTRDELREERDRRENFDQSLYLFISDQLSVNRCGAYAARISMGHYVHIPVRVAHWKG